MNEEDDLPSLCKAPIEWDELASRSVHQETGYTEDVLDYIWCKYCIISIIL